MSPSANFELQEAVKLNVRMLSPVATSSESGKIVTNPIYVIAKGIVQETSRITSRGTTMIILNGELVVDNSSSNLSYNKIEVTLTISVTLSSNSNSPETFEDITNKISVQEMVNEGIASPPLSPMKILVNNSLGGKIFYLCIL